MSDKNHNQQGADCIPGGSNHNPDGSNSVASGGTDRATIRDDQGLQSLRRQLEGIKRQVYNAIDKVDQEIGRRNG